MDEERTVLMISVVALAPALGLKKAEADLIIALIEYDEAPSPRQLANDLGINRSKLKAVLSRLDDLGFVKVTPEGLYDFSGLLRAMDAIPVDEKQRLFEADLSPEEP